MPKLNHEAKTKRKKMILDAAFKVFSQLGYNDTTMDHIVTESGISKGGIYTYFTSKEEVFLEIASSRFRKRSELLLQMRQDYMDQTGQTHYELLMRDYLKSILQSLSDPDVLNTAKFSFEFWSIATREPTLNQVAQQRYHNFYQVLAEQLSEGIDAGYFSKNIHLDAVGYIILSTLDGMMHTHAIMGIKIPNHAIDQYVESIMSILLAL
ncbi:TetR/AcrR family transcriptional regulator [Fusibacter bizertensis]